VFLNADGDIEFDNSHRIKLTSNNSDPVIAIGGSGPNFIRFHDGSDFTDATNAVDIIYRTSPNDLLIERGGNDIASFGGDDGHAALYYNNSIKLETVSGGIDVTGEIAATSLDISGDVDVDGTLEADAMTLNGTAITTTATLSTGISNNNVPKFTSGVADNDFLRVDGTAIEGRSASEVLSDIGGLATDGNGSSLTNVNAATLDSLDSTSFLRSDADDSFSNQIDGTTIELAGGVTYDPPGSSGSDTATDVAIALLSGQRIVMGTSGYIRTIVDATASQPLQFGQSGTGYFTGTKIFGGSTDVKLHYNADAKLATTSDGINVTGTVTDDGATHDGDVTFTGASYNVLWDKSDNAFELADNAKLKFGAGDDMEIFSDGTYGRIDVNDLIIRGDDTDNRPQIYFQDYNTSNVVDYDTTTNLYFQGHNDAGQQVTYNTIQLISMDVSDGTEDGRIQFAQLEAGASATTFIFDPYYFLLMSEQQLAWYQYNGSYSTYLNPLTPTANRFIKLPDRDGLVRVVSSQTMTANLAVGWHTIAVFQGRDDSPGGANQRFHAKFSLADVTSSRHQALTFYAQHIFGQDDGLQVIGNSTFGTDVVTAIRIKSSTDSNKTYAGAAIQVYVADATNNLILYLDEANLDDSPNGVSYGNVILKTGVADASDPGDLGYSSASYSTFASSVNVGIDSIEPGGIGVTGNLLTQSNIVLEGATADAHETIITATDATADRTITLPNATGTVALTSDIPSSGISSGNVATFTSGAADNDFLRIDGTAIEGRSASEVLSDIAAMPLAGGTFSGDVTLTGDNYNIVFDKSDDALEFADNAKAKFGTGGDLQIYHNGSNSIIHDSGTGVILVRTSTLKVNNAGNTEKLIHAFDGGAVELYHNNSKKLETASGGITVTGEVAATSLDISGDVDVDGTLEADAITLNGTTITTTATLSTGISNGNVPVFTSGVADDDFLRVNGTSIEGRSASELASDIGAATTDDATALAIALG